jgi:hypothetical protein
VYVFVFDGAPHGRIYSDIIYADTW